MLMASLAQIRPSLFVVVVLVFPVLAAALRSETVYDILPTYGLPPGLLPDNVKSYTLSNDGRFVVELNAPCYVQFEYLVYFDQTVTGILELGKISDLKGVQVQKFLLWLDVDEIKVDLPPNDYIYFQIGWITKELDVEQFRTVHSCDESGVGCGKAMSRFFKLKERPMDATMLLTE